MATKTANGLTIHAELDRTMYPTGIKVTNQQMKALALRKRAVRGEWNYSISPQE